MRAGPGNLITDVPGLRVGHAEDALAATGVTAVMFDLPACASVSILGGAPGSRDTALLEPEMSVQTVDSIVLSGGSVFGLDAAGGVLNVLSQQGRGLAVAGVRVPIVAQAILFDLVNGGAKRWLDDPRQARPPYWDLGQSAALAASRTFALGSVGAGLGATTANLKGGVGSASTGTGSGLVVGALAVVNAVGSAVIGDGPHFWAAPFEIDGEFGDRGWPDSIDAAARALRMKGGALQATTIALVATNACLGKAECKRLAIMAHDGLARALRPAHAPMDGDTVFAAATGAQPGVVDAAGLAELGSAAADCLARAIARGVYEALPLDFPGALPSWRDLYGHRTP